jgi:hypothetical protein
MNHGDHKNLYLKITKQIKERIVKSLIVLMMFAFALEAQALIEDRRCNEWGDSLNLGKQVIARYEWAIHCETDEDKTADIDIAYKEGIADKKGRVSPGYPSYGKREFEGKQFKYVNSDKWFAPPRTKDGGHCFRPGGYKIVFYCAAGCYTPEQKILVPGAEIELGDAFHANVTDVETLSPDSSLDRIQLKTNRVFKYTTDAVPGKQEILEFRMASGGSLKVTPNHPLVTGDGKVVAASELEEGQSLIRVEGIADPRLEFDIIESIVPYSFYGSVYNLSINSINDKENIVIVQRYLNGSLKYQNEWIDHLNRKLLRKVVALDILK